MSSDSKFCLDKKFGHKIFCERYKFSWTYIFSYFFQTHFFCQTPVQLQSEVDFVLPLSEEDQEQSPPKSTRMKCTPDLEFGTKT